MPTQPTMTTKTVYEARRENLAKLMAHKGAKTQLAERLGTTQAHITHLLKPTGAQSARPIHEETARQIEAAIGLPAGELDKGAVYARPAPKLAPVDLDMLEHSVKAVLAEVAATHAKLTDEKTASAVRLVHDHSLALGHVDPAFVTQLIKLMR